MFTVVLNAAPAANRRVSLADAVAAGAPPFEAAVSEVSGETTPQEPTSLQVDADRMDIQGGFLYLFKETATAAVFAPGSWKYATPTEVTE